MFVFFLTLAMEFATTYLPTGGWDLVLARAATCFLEKGMCEEQVRDGLGWTLYKVRMNSMGGFAAYPQFRLRLDFSYPGGSLRSARFMRIEKLSSRECCFRYLQELPLR
jgi:hypothetical protein